jgi:hypothetical protein
MKVRVTMEVVGRKIDEVLSGPNADEIVGAAKSKVARELGWKGLFLTPLTPLAFAQMAVKQYNEAHRANYTIPNTCDEFLKLGEGLGYITFLDG